MLRYVKVVTNHILGDFTYWVIDIYFINKYRLPKPPTFTTKTTWKPRSNVPFWPKTSRIIEQSATTTIVYPYRRTRHEIPAMPRFWWRRKMTRRLCCFGKSIRRPPAWLLETCSVFPNWNLMLRKSLPITKSINGLKQLGRTQTSLGLGILSKRFTKFHPERMDGSREKFDRPENLP